MSALADNGSIGVYDLRTHLSSVLEEVIAGREVTVTRHGHAIARIAPVSATTDEARIAAIERIKERRNGRKLGMSAAELIREMRDSR